MKLCQSCQVICCRSMREVKKAWREMEHLIAIGRLRQLCCTPDMLPQRWREECARQVPNFASIAAAPEEEYQEFQEILKANIAEAKDDCSICLRKLEADMEHVSDLPVITMPCKHGFHDKCLSNWLATNDKCPL